MLFAVLGIEFRAMGLLGECSDPTSSLLSLSLLVGLVGLFEFCMSVHTNDPESTKRGQIPLKLDLNGWVVMSQPAWMLETDLGSSVRALLTTNISPTPPFLNPKKIGRGGRDTKKHLT